MYKKGRVLRYLKLDNYHVFRQFIENEITVNDIQQALNVSNQLVINALKKIDPDVIQKREQDIDYRLETICDMVFEGVPMDYIIEETDIAKPIKRHFVKSPTNGKRASTINKIGRRGIADPKKVRNYAMIREKLRFYINILQIEDDIINTPKDVLNLRVIASRYEASYNKVLERSHSIRDNGRAITTIDDAVYQVLKRNVKLTARYCRGTSMSVLKRENKDLRYLDDIIKSYEPYIKGVR